MSLRLALLLAVAACAPAPGPAQPPVARGRTTAVVDVVRGHALWAARSQRAHLEGALSAWRRAVSVADDDAASWLMLARAEYLLADSHLDDDAAITRSFAEGASAADRGLRALSPRYEQQRRAGVEVDDAAADLGPEAAPYLYWWALNVIRWGERQGWTTGLGLVPPVLAAMHQVATLAPGYEHGGGDRFLGGFYAAAPSLAGGDLGKARLHLLRAVALSPLYLENHLVIAERYARKIGDRVWFDAALRLVRDTPAQVMPSVVPEQVMAKQKAARLLRM